MGLPTNQKPPPFVFVLMPFRDEFREIYERGIKNVCEGLGAKCERVDEQIYKGSVVDRIFKQIAKADIIIAELSASTANVFYETGYAHALGKTVITLVRAAEETPFNLSHLPHIAYAGSIDKLQDELRRRLLHWLNPENDPDHPLLGKWKSLTIIDESKPDGVQSEVVDIESVIEGRVYGKVVSEEENQSYCVCELQGMIHDRYLQLNWYPATENGSQDLIDYGCYFLEKQPNGSYKGYVVGYFWHLARVDAYRQTLTRIR